MKKSVLFFHLLGGLLLLLSLSSCSNDSHHEDPWQAKTLLNVLSNTWIYDDPSSQVWERDRFTTSGQFYSSYYSNALYNIEETVNGQYTLSGNSIVGQYRLSSGTLLNIDWTIKNINELEGTFVVNTTGGLTYTYSRLLTTLNLQSGQTVKPDYDILIPDTITVYTNSNAAIGFPNITGFSSHNSQVASVSTDGSITANGSGRTYIDVITTEGTAVVEVNVTPSFMDYDYERFIGADRSSIKETFGSNTFYEDSTTIMYTNNSGKFAYTTFRFDQITKLVKVVSLSAQQGTSLSTDEVETYLGKRFYVYEQGTETDFKAYINAATLADATIGITFDTENKVLTYVAISHDLFTDYSSLLGRTRAEVSSVMGDSPFSNTDEYVAYMVSNNSYIRYVMFSFNNYSSGVQNTVQAIVLSVKNTADKDKIYEYLNGKYTYQANYSTDTEKMFTSSDGLTIVYFDMENNMIQYFPNSVSASSKYALLKQVRTIKH